MRVGGRYSLRRVQRSGSRAAIIKLPLVPSYSYFVIIRAVQVPLITRCHCVKRVKLRHSLSSPLLGLLRHSVYCFGFSSYGAETVCWTADVRGITIGLTFEKKKKMWQYFCGHVIIALCGKPSFEIGDSCCPYTVHYETFLNRPWVKSMHPNRLWLAVTASQRQLHCLFSHSAQMS